MAVNWAGLIGIFACVAGIFIGDDPRTISCFKQRSWYWRLLSELLDVKTNITTNDATTGRFQKGLYLPLPHPANVPVQYMDPDNVPKFGQMEVFPSL